MGSATEMRGMAALKVHLLRRISVERGFVVEIAVRGRDVDETGVVA